MRSPSVSNVVTILLHGRTHRAVVRRSYKRRFIVSVWIPDPWSAEPESTADLSHHTTYSFERVDEGKLWMRGWDSEDAVAFRAQMALAASR